MKRTIALVAACGCWLIPGSAQAQTAGVPLKMDAGFYVGATLGRSDARDFCNVGGACDEEDVSWNAFAGYRFNRHFALEAAYSDFGKASSSGIAVGVASTISQETTAYELVALGSVPLGDAFALYAKAGFFRYESDSVGTGGLSGARSDKGTELTLGLGAEWSFRGGLAARLEWQRYFSVGTEFQAVPKNDIQVLRLGARYHF